MQNPNMEPGNVAVWCRESEQTWSGWENVHEADMRQWSLRASRAGLVLARGDWMERWLGRARSLLIKDSISFSAFPVKT